MSTLDDRFWAKTRREGECIIWIGTTKPYGYGKLGRNGKTYFAHRYAYELLVGPIPDGLELDHLCRNRACVNVEHLEPVTRRENQLRGKTFAAANASKTHCPHGHEYTPDNIYWAGNHRRCATCVRERMRRYRAA